MPKKVVKSHRIQILRTCTSRLPKPHTCLLRQGGGGHRLYFCSGCRPTGYMMAIFRSLRAKSLWWIICAMATGMLATAMWMHSMWAWEQHLNQAYIAGLKLNTTIRNNAPVQDGMILSKLSGPDSKLADAGLFAKLPDVCTAHQGRCCTGRCLCTLCSPKASPSVRRCSRSSCQTCNASDSSAAPA